MTLVRIIKNWDKPDLMRQTPGSRGKWEDIKFTLDPVDRCDYVVVLNYVPEPTRIECPPEHVWMITQEPPNEHFRLMHRGNRKFRKIFTQDVNLKGDRYIHSHPALPWHVDKTYDFLSNCDIPEKSQKLSWITSNIAAFEGHRARLRFLDKIQGQVEFDLFGRGFTYIEDKWDGLAPYQYSLVVENFQNPHYWSEKIADCFLSWTVPIYYGCTEIERYFPPEALFQIDINDPKVVDQIKDITSRKIEQRNLEAIAEARTRVLNDYQLFPFVAQKIAAYATQKRQQAKSDRYKMITLSSGEPWTYKAHQRYSRFIPGPIRSLLKVLFIR